LSLPFFFLSGGATVRTAIALAAAFLLVALLPEAGYAELPVVSLSAGVHLIHAEVADNDLSRSRGLMFRRSLEPNRGMFFVFENAAAHCMWMKNTLIPLSVAFLDDSGTITNIEDMQPETEDSHCAKRPARYALEMEQGWFAQRGIRAGFRLRGIEKLRR
jgi:uncharacterized membrane protein (UPF0127 family)